MDTLLKDRLLEYTNLINETIENTLVVDSSLEKKLVEAMKYSLMAGGKRIRPALILEGYRLFDKDYKEALSFALAMEMVHTFSLIHDDLPAIDNDDLRRGKPTNHKVFGECTAILAGDALLNNAYKVIAEDMESGKNVQNKVNAFKIFSDNIFNMIKGEFVDTDLEGKDIGIDELMYMHNNKTGALIKASLMIGATLSGASLEEKNILEKYAELIGLTFQIKDDILSEEGNEKILGKPIGNDKTKGKRTFVTVFGLKAAKEKLEEYTNNAVLELKKLDRDTRFLEELAVFIKDREN